jgi:uncharacterized protein (DUF2141 family)
VGAALFDSVESFPQRDDALATAWIAADGERVAWVVDDLDPGTYAVAVFQDLDGDGKLSRASLGPPSEPYAFSNDARGTFGPPKFQQAAVRLQAGDAEIVIALR